MLSSRVLKDQNLIQEKAERQSIKKSFHKWLHVFPVHEHMEKIKLIISDYSDKGNSLSLNSKSRITASSIDINHTHNNVIMVNSNTDFQWSCRNKNTRNFEMLCFVSPRFLKLSLVALISLKYNFDFSISTFLFCSYHNIFCNLCCIFILFAKTGELGVFEYPS